MFATKRQGKVLAVLFVFAIGTLVLTVGIFAGGDFSPHEKYSHIHRSDESELGVDWIVEVGRLEWNNISTYSWHKVYVRNNSDDTVTGEWEWKHYVRNEQGGGMTDKHVGSVNLSGDAGDELLSKSGWASVDLTDDGTYRIEAYTRVSLIKGGSSLTAGGLGQRDIMSKWFTIGN